MNKTDKIIFRLLGNLCYMVKQSFNWYFCLLIPSAGQNTDWWEADSFQKNKSAIFVQHSINFSWPNSKKCNQSASEFSLCAKISPVVRDKVGWEQVSEELSLDWQNHRLMKGNSKSLLFRAHRTIEVCFTIVTVSKAFASTILCTMAQGQGCL